MINLYGNFENQEEPTLTVVVEEEKKISDEKISEKIPDLTSFKEEVPEKYKIEKGFSNYINDILQNHVPVLANMPHHDGEDLTDLTSETKPTIEEFREQVIAAENETKESLTLEDYELIAELVIEVIDWVVSSGLMWISGDKSDEEYILNSKRKERLQSMLLRYLVKMDKKVSFGALFMFSLIIMLVGPTRKALKNRKLNKLGTRKPNISTTTDETIDVKHTEIKPEEDQEKLKSAAPFKFGKKDLAPDLKKEEKPEKVEEKAAEKGEVSKAVPIKSKLEKIK